MEGGEENQNKQDGSIVASSQDNDFNPVKPASTAIPPEGPEGSISWTASEFVSHKKGALWYFIVLLAFVFLGGLIYLLTKDKVSSSSIIIIGIIFAIFGGKRPRELEYRVDRYGLHIGKRTHSFNNFRSFAVDQKGAFSSIVLFPMKRFSFLTTAYYDPRDEQKIVAIISSYLPMEDKKRDFIDDLMWKIRF